MKITKTSILVLVVTASALLLVGALIDSWVKTARETEDLVVSRHAVSRDASTDHEAMTADGNSQNSGSGVEKAGSVSSPASAGHLTAFDAVRTLPVTGNLAQAPGHQGEDAGVSVFSVQSASIARSVVPQQTQSSGTFASESTSTSASAPRAIPIPAVFGNSASAGVASPEQAQQIVQIASNFTKTVESSGVAPDSPAYQRAWNSAASTADALYKQQYGWQAFEAMQHNTATP